ncbi:MAG TPA: UPF0182 family protein [Chloroflexia bacterium]|nr:UPF0182 family protein [Chloroflexia bacterium]
MNSKNNPNRPVNINGSSSNAAPPPRKRRSLAWLWWLIAAILLLVIIVPSLLAEAITDWMWFGSQDLADVYTTRLWLALAVFAGALIVGLVFLLANWMVALRASRPATLYEGQQDPMSRGTMRWIAIIAAIVLAFFMALAVAGEWPTILLYLKGGSFGQTDPLFHNDIGFYVFELPFYRLLRGWALVLLVMAAIGTALVYLASNYEQLSRRFTGQVTMGPGGRRVVVNPVAGPPIRLPQSVEVHMTILGAIFLLLLAVGYWLDRFDLLYSSRAVAYGAGYTDVNAKLPAITIMLVIALAMAVLLLINLRVRTWKLLAGALGLWLLALIAVDNIYPAIIQQFVVKPSESQMETPYIENNIAATRAAFGLDKFHEQEVPAVTSITREQIDENPNITNNIRLWDYRPLQDTYGQLQSLRSYYSLDGVDIDRYTLGGVQRQVMLAPRELNSDNLAENIRTWENVHFRYTHGYGLAMSPVNEIQGEGLPELLIKDIPPVSTYPELQVTRPEIYYGEATDQYVFVNSSEIQEFDYPVGDTNKLTRYEGKGGVAINDLFTKILFAARFGDGNILISNYVTDGTRVLYHRNIRDMVETLAPFLLYEDDPYMVLSGGKLYWIMDAETYTDRYPYSTPYDGSSLEFNYIRNSVKVVIDAYEGTATYYVIDPTDPIVNAYRGIFPDLFKDISEMPPGLIPHLRYPEGLLDVQARMYSTYHMTDPQVFYQKEDVWALPAANSQDHTASTLVPPEAYYVNIQLPGESKVDFMLIQSFTPSTKDNMIAWMAAKGDPNDYGKVEVIRYPKQELVFGPKQIEARIDQDPVISQQLTLWSQSGSNVIRGNLLTIPISNTLLYIEPLFLQANNSSFPELKRVIVATGNSVGIGSDLNEALDVAFKLKPGEVIPGGDTGTPNPNATPVPTLPPGATVTPGGTQTAQTAEQLTQSALDHYNRAQDALRNGDWTTYGEEIDAMKADLDQLAQITGVPIPTTIP